MGTAHPIFASQASGNRVIDLEGNEYIDFCLGDTGAMFGHSPEATAETVAQQVRRGITTIMLTAEALDIGQELGRRFELPLWPVATGADNDGLVQGWDDCLAEIATRGPET